MVLSPTALDDETLLERYVEIANRALEAHEDEFPYTHILDVAERVLRDQPIGVELASGGGVKTFTIFMDKGRIRKVPGETPGMDTTWRVGRDYLEKVASHPQRYVSNPVLLDWDWLKSRLGLGGA